LEFLYLMNEIVYHGLSYKNTDIVSSKQHSELRLEE
jgi:hypothetical protein